MLNLFHIYKKFFFWHLRPDETDTTSLSLDSWKITLNSQKARVYRTIYSVNKLYHYKTGASDSKSFF